jgi:hypothetical protein
MTPEEGRRSTYRAYKIAGISSTRQANTKTITAIITSGIAAARASQAGQAERLNQYNTELVVEWREGISPSRSPKTGHEPLDSSGSYCPALN